MVCAHGHVCVCTCVYVCMCLYIGLDWIDRAHTILGIQSYLYVARAMLSQMLLLFLLKE